MKVNIRYTINRSPSCIEDYKKNASAQNVEHTIDTPTLFPRLFFNITFKKKSSHKQSTENTKIDMITEPIFYLFALRINFPRPFFIQSQYIPKKI